MQYIRECTWWGRPGRGIIIFNENYSTRNNNLISNKNTNNTNNI